jgi:hypothetical protein
MDHWTANPDRSLPKIAEAVFGKALSIGRALSPRLYTRSEVIQGDTDARIQTLKH